MKRSWIALTLVCIALALSSSPAWAQQPSDAERAVTLGNEGVEMFKKGQWQQARERFEAAEKLVHSPVLLVYVARSMRNAGDLVGARAAYARVAAEQLPAKAPTQWAQAKDDAAREAAELDKRIPTLTIQVRGPTQPSAIRVDGAELPPQRWGTALPYNPGRHAVVATVPAGGKVDSTVVLAEGDPPQTFVIDLGTPAKAATPPSGGRVASPDAGRSGSVWPGVVTLGVGTLALGTGIVAGLVAKSKEEDIESRCPTETQCLPSDEAEADAAKDLATVSTIGFVAAAIAVPAGVALLVWRPFGRSSAGVVVRPSRIALAGSF